VGGEPVEGVVELIHGGRIGMPETDVVRRDDTEAVRQQRDEVTVHVRRRREAVQEHADRVDCVAGCAVEGAQTIDVDEAVLDSSAGCGAHGVLLCRGIQAASCSGGATGKSISV
jgi:hypothetical protein